MKEILAECQDIVEEICEKYGYDNQDVEGNDSLKTVLLKVIPAMLKDAKKEDRELFYQMLRHTPIIVTENLTQEGYDSLKKQYLGTNPHIIKEELDRGEYGKGVPAGSYESEVILDENLRVQGKKSFVFIERVGIIEKEFLGTDINVSHLIHELGHAWNAESGQYEMQEDGTLKEKVGTVEIIYSFSRGQDDRYVMREVSSEGLMLEEALNTIAEEEAMANYMGISLQEMKDAYIKTLVPSNYQGLMLTFIERMLEQLDAEEIKEYRLHGNEKLKNTINNLMEKTEFWENREKDIHSEESERSYQAKRNIIESIDNERVREFFSQYGSIYFPNISTMTPLQKIENVLTQWYNLKNVKYSIPIEKYRELVLRMKSEIIPLINQAGVLKQEQEVLKAVSDVTRTELIEISLETRNAVENSRAQIKEQNEEVMSEKKETER